MYARILQGRYDSSDLSLWGDEAAAVDIDFNFYDCRSWESPFSYTLVPGNPTYDGTNAGQVSVEYSDLNSGVTIVDFVASLNVATVHVSGPQLPAISGKNNGGEKCHTCPCPPGEKVLALVGDPINAGTGNLFETQTDFTAAPETQLSFTRYYNSFDQSSAGLGVGWHSTYHRGLIATATAVTVTRADGRQDIYTKSGSSYVPDPDVTSVLTPVPATGTQTGWKLKLADDSTENYTLAGLLDLDHHPGGPYHHSDLQRRQSVDHRNRPFRP